MTPNSRLDDYQDLTLEFAIDREIERLSKAKGSQAKLRYGSANLNNAKLVARRAIMVAASEAMGTTSNTKGAAITDDWKQIAEAIEETDRAIGHLMRALAGSCGHSPPEGTVKASIAHILSQISRKGDEQRSKRAPAETAGMRRPLNSRTTESRAASAIQFLNRYLATLRPAAAKYYEFVSASKPRTNLGKPEKTAFVWVLGEAWVYLTGRIPGTSATLETNPFARFAAVAWLDAFGQSGTDFEGENFSRAIEPVSEALRTSLKSKLDTFEPSWL